MPEKKVPAGFKLGKNRHSWTAEEDRLLLQLVERHGPSWTFISSQLGIEGSIMKARRRWEALQPKENGLWTKAEDEDLANVVNKYVDLGYTLSEKHVWANIAQQLKTNRSPRQCYTRWSAALLPLQGAALPFTRFEKVRGWTWSDGELERLRAAIAVTTQLLDPPADVDCAQKDEPWLLIRNGPADTLKPQFWGNVASFVGTRTGAQCRCKWRYTVMCRAGSGQPVTTEEAQRLARLVKQHGTKWMQLCKNYFPERTPVELQRIYTRWRQLEKKYNVDLLDIDPFSIISDFDGKCAMRPTGPDGNYDPAAPPRKIYGKKSTFFMMPYVLALANANTVGSASPRIKQVLGIPRSSDRRSAGGGLSAKQLDKLVAAISRFGSDWVAVSKEVGMSIVKCRKYAHLLVSAMSSLGVVITNPDLASLAQKRGWKGTQQK